MISPIVATKENGIAGETCAYCKMPFAPGDALVVCPVDQIPHHTYCWEATGNSCAALGCSGNGAITSSTSPNGAQAEAVIAPPEPVVVTEPVPVSAPPVARPPAARPRGRTRPEHVRPNRQRQRVAAPTVTAATAPRPNFTLSLAQSCLVMAVVLAIIVIAFSCFGLWAIADYVAIEVMGWGYRPLP